MTSIENVSVTQRRAIIKEYRQRVLARLQEVDDYYGRYDIPLDRKASFKIAMKQVAKEPLVPG